MSRAEVGADGSPGNKKARYVEVRAADRPEKCLLEIVSKLAGEPWTDHPTCVHPTLGAIARAVHDYSSATGRVALRPLAPAFIGTAHTGLETPARLVALCASTALAGAEPANITTNERGRLIAARRTALHLLAEGEAGDSGDDDEPRLCGAARWWFPVLRRVALAEPFYRTFVATEQAAEAVAVTARASAADRDIRLRQLLRQCIAATPTNRDVRTPHPDVRTPHPDVRTLHPDVRAR